ncbi:MAG: hypothetical protein ACR2HG_14180 [Pyrinomonadaceae bacterium]
MKNRLLKFSMIGIISLVLFSVADGQAKKNAEKIIEPTAKEAIKQILSNGDIPLSVGKNCQSVGTAKDDRTILDFISGILSFQAAPNSTNQIEFTFKQEKGKRNEIIWVCDLLFRGKDEEDVWSNGVRFKMRNADRRLLRDSLMCIGTG